MRNKKTEPGKIKVLRNHIVKYKLEYYQGTLSFPCDFCESNSYDNLHISKDGVLIVVCKDCIEQTLKNKKMEVD